MTGPAVVVLGAGFVGAEVARRALVAGREVVVSSRDSKRAAGLRAGLPGAAVVGPDAALDGIAGRDLVVTYPPEPQADARFSARAAAARAIVYVSSTAVYGATEGRIDDGTPVAPASPRGHRRLAAEGCWRAAGAVVLRAPGIYGMSSAARPGVQGGQGGPGVQGGLDVQGGPGVQGGLERGVHLRLRAGSYRLPGRGDNHVSRIHVGDLAACCLAALARGVRGAAHVVGDLEPTTHRVLVAHLCAQLGLPLPPSTPLTEVHETLRGNRRVDPRPALAALAVTLARPTYRQYLEADR